MTVKSLFSAAPTRCAASMTWLQIGALPSASAGVPIAQEHHVGIRRGGGKVSGESRAGRRPRCRDQLQEAGLMDRQLAFLQAGDARRVNIDADRIVAKIGKSGPGDQPNIPCSDDADLRD